MHTMYYAVENSTKHANSRERKDFEWNFHKICEILAKAVKSWYYTQINAETHWRMVLSYVGIILAY